jgi:zinc transporter ZupT
MRIRILAAVLIGDFFHNLCDGIFIGAAFKGCGKSVGWTVTLSTVLHELPQEIADYYILTSPGAALGPVLALVLNFVSGMSVVLGAIIVLASDPDDSSVGMLLAWGAGVYLHIGAVECMPKIYEAKLSAWLRVASVLAFILGTVLIGLVLLDHEHCVPAVPSTEGASPPSGGGHHH